MGDRFDNIGGIAQLFGDEGAVLTAALLCTAVLLLLVWLLLRRLKLWYWKVNVQVDALKGIDQKLHDLEEGIKESAVSADRPLAAEEAEGEAAPETENSEQIPRMPEMAYSVGKTGTIYTEEELDMIIKD